LPIDDPSLWDTVRDISLSVWVTGGIMIAALFWFLKWLFVILFVQGKGIGLVTVPVSRMAGKILEDKFAQKFADSKLLPKLHPPQNWEEFNRFTGHVADRMRTYRELVYLVQAKFNGPSAVSLRVAVQFFEPIFVDTFRTAERGFRDLDKIDAEMRVLHRNLHIELEEATAEIERERVALERDFEIKRVRLKSLLTNRRAKFWLWRPFSALYRRIFGTSAERSLRAEKKALNKKLVAIRKDLKETNRRIFADHHPEVIGVCLELIEHDQMFLKHLYFRFGLEMESLTFTIASGRVLQLMAENTPAGAAAREAMDLQALGDLDEAHPMIVDRIRTEIRCDTDLATYVGLGPESVLEGALEPYLRIKLLLGKLNLEGYSPHWVAHLPPPAEFGRAQAEYDHFSHQLAWLKRTPPGLKVATNGLVSFEDDPFDADLQAAE
jgi:hypothetical protein